MQNIIPKYNPTKQQQLLEKYKKNIHSNTVERWENHKGLIFHELILEIPFSGLMELTDHKEDLKVVQMYPCRRYLRKKFADTPQGETL